MKLIGCPCPGRLYVEAPFSLPHRGIDYKADWGTAVLAAHQGLVRIGRKMGGGYGLFVRVMGFVDEAPLETLYAHLSQVTVEDGAWVRRGQMIGRVGNTGTDLPHLHFELHWQGATVDPFQFMEVEGGEDSDVG